MIKHAIDNEKFNAVVANIFGDIEIKIQEPFRAEGGALISAIYHKDKKGWCCVHVVLSAQEMRTHKDAAIWELVKSRTQNAKETLLRNIV